MRNYKETLEWYRTHQTAKQIGFDPDGMCLKICRTARNIGAVYPTAVAAQEATPMNHRHYKVKDLRKGMVLYFDDPNDSNRFGHIVTMVGRVDGFNPDDLNDVLVETNSVKANEVVVVRASYFKTHWGDAFKFGATWLNGQVLDVYEWGDDAKPPERPTIPSPLAVKRFKASHPEWDLDILRNAVKNGRPDLKPYVDKIEAAVEKLPDTSKDERLGQFLTAYEKKGLLKMALLNDMIRDNPRRVRVKAQRDRIRQVIKSLPES